jgi:hypothetical protein
MKDGDKLFQLGSMFAIVKSSEGLKPDSRQATRELILKSFSSAPGGLLIEVNLNDPKIKDTLQKQIDAENERLGLTN